MTKAWEGVKALPPTLQCTTCRQRSGRGQVVNWRGICCGRPPAPPPRRPSRGRARPGSSGRPPPAGGSTSPPGHPSSRPSPHLLHSPLSLLCPPRLPPSPPSTSLSVAAGCLGQPWGLCRPVASLHPSFILVSLVHCPEENIQRIFASIYLQPLGVPTKMRCDPNLQGRLSLPLLVFTILI